MIVGQRQLQLRFELDAILVLTLVHNYEPTQDGDLNIVVCLAPFPSLCRQLQLHLQLKLLERASLTSLPV